MSSSAGDQRMPLGKRVRESFFTPVENEEHVWRCICGVTRKQSGTGYQNLKSHVQYKHPDRFKELLEVSESNTAFLTNQSLDIGSKVSYFYKPKVVSMHGWIDLVTSCLLPFSIVEARAYRANMKHLPISKESLSKYMDLLTRRVEAKIRKMLPNKFAVAFDGWSEGDTHYVAIFGSIPAKNELGYQTLLLGFSPFEDELSQDADHHKAFLGYVLQLFGKSYDNVVALLGDNCSTNRAFAGKAQVPLVGCALHRFNLAVQDIIRPKKAIVDKVSALMKKLRSPIASAKLRKHTHLRAKCNNVTRWSSTYEMLARYQRIKEFIGELDVTGIDEFVPTYREEKQIETLCNHLSDMNSVTNALQRDSITLSQVRDLFDAVITKFPQTSVRLNADASIVRDKHFESGIVSIQRGTTGTMSEEEKRDTERLKLGSNEQTRTASTTMSFAEEVLKKRKICSEYCDLRFILPTTNIVERFFSKAGHALGSRRKQLTPANLEVQLFLHMNSGLWKVQDVNAIMD